MGPCAREDLNDHTGRGDMSPSVGAPACGTEDNLTPELTTHWLNAAPEAAVGPSPVCLLMCSTFVVQGHTT